ncbi:hypothetical protein SAY86_025031 [Trapa natans]|uniref:Uncharacterized protein n=1 Tax=Trapa natans TaxID=22666 RepID=A0AAN7RIL9_TRANT|nr:hypothetical protein SAY86_025031 [Trapa natans]
MEVSNLLGANRLVCPPLQLRPLGSGRGPRRSSFAGKLKVVAKYSDQKQTAKDKWRGLAFDTSDDQQDITRGKGMVDTLFQAPEGSVCGTHFSVMSSYDYMSTALGRSALDNNVDGLYIAPAFMDKVVIHIAKNFLNLPDIKVPLILGVWVAKARGSHSNVI